MKPYQWYLLAPLLWVAIAFMWVREKITGVKS